MIWKIKSIFFNFQPSGPKPSRWPGWPAFPPPPSARSPGGPASWQRGPAGLSGAPASPVEFDPLSEDPTRLDLNPTQIRVHTG
jgi:hypothetical protein